MWLIEPFINMATPVRRNAFLILLSLAAAAGCTKINEGNVDPNTVDPPEVNPSPIQRVRLFVSAPPTLNVRLVADYRIGIWLGMMGGGGTYCGSESDRTGKSGFPLASSKVPVDLKWDGRRYQGEFYIDRLLPGRCHWRFFGLDALSPMKDGVSLYSDYAGNYNFDTSHSRGIYDNSPNQSADLWCVPDRDWGQREKGEMQCQALFSYLLSPGTVSNDLLAIVPVDQRDHVPRVNIFPFTKSITLRFHDLEAENRAAIASAQGRGEADKPCPAGAVRVYVDREGSIVANGTPQVAGVGGFGLSRFIDQAQPTPRLVCFASALPPGGTPVSPGGTVIDAVALLGMPLATYADNTFAKGATLK